MEKLRHRNSFSKLQEMAPSEKTECGKFVVVQFDPRFKGQSIDIVRELAELVLYGEQNGKKEFFEFFAEKNLFAYFVACLGLEEAPIPIRVQLLQTVTLLLHNMREKTNLYFMLSNNHVNSLLCTRFPIMSDAANELAAYYISLLKNLALGLDSVTARFFLNANNTWFPLFSEAVKLLCHPDPMVRTGAQTVVLKLLGDADDKVHQHILQRPRVFDLIACTLRRMWLQVDRTHVLGLTDDFSDPGKKPSGQGGVGGSPPKEVLDALDDQLLFIEDILTLGSPAVSRLMLDRLMRFVFIPLLAGTILKRPLNVTLTVKHNRKAGIFAPENVTAPDAEFVMTGDDENDGGDCEPGLFATPSSATPSLSPPSYPTSNHWLDSVNVLSSVRAAIFFANRVVSVSNSPLVLDALTDCLIASNIPTEWIAVALTPPPVPSLLKHMVVDPSELAGKGHLLLPPEDDPLIGVSYPTPPPLEPALMDRYASPEDPPPETTPRLLRRTVLTETQLAACNALATTKHDAWKPEIVTPAVSGRATDFTPNPVRSRLLAWFAGANSVPPCEPLPAITKLHSAVSTSPTCPPPVAPSAVVDCWWSTLQPSRLIHSLPPALKGDLGLRTYAPLYKPLQPQSKSSETVSANSQGREASPANSCMTAETGRGGECDAFALAFNGFILLLSRKLGLDGSGGVLDVSLSHRKEGWGLVPGEASAAPLGLLLVGQLFSLHHYRPVTTRVAITAIIEYIESAPVRNNSRMLEATRMHVTHALSVLAARLMKVGQTQAGEWLTGAFSAAFRLAVTMPGCMPKNAPVFQQQVLASKPPQEVLDACTGYDPILNLCIPQSNPACAHHASTSNSSSLAASQNAYTHHHTALQRATDPHFIDESTLGSASKTSKVLKVTNAATLHALTSTPALVSDALALGGGLFCSIPGATATPSSHTAYPQSWLGGAVAANFACILMEKLAQCMRSAHVSLFASQPTSLISPDAPEVPAGTLRRRWVESTKALGKKDSISDLDPTLRERLGPEELATRGYKDFALWEYGTDGLRGGQSGNRVFVEGAAVPVPTTHKVACAVLPSIVVAPQSSIGGSNVGATHRAAPPKNATAAQALVADVVAVSSSKSAASSTTAVSSGVSFLYSGEQQASFLSSMHPDVTHLGPNPSQHPSALRRYILLHPEYLLLVTPDVSSPSHARVRTVASLRDVELVPSRSDPRIATILIRSTLSPADATPLGVLVDPIPTMNAGMGNSYTAASPHPAHAHQNLNDSGDDPYALTGLEGANGTLVVEQCGGAVGNVWQITIAFDDVRRATVVRTLLENSKRSLREWQLGILEQRVYTAMGGAVMLAAQQKGQ